MLRPEHCVAPALRALDDVCLFHTQGRPGEPFQFDGACAGTRLEKSLLAYNADTSGCLRWAQSLPPCQASLIMRNSVDPRR